MTHEKEIAAARVAAAYNLEIESLMELLAVLSGASKQQQDAMTFVAIGVATGMKIRTPISEQASFRLVL